MPRPTFWCNLPRVLLLLVASLVADLAGGFARAAPPKAIHLPHQPHSNQGVRIAVQDGALGNNSKPSLEYQVVEPGNYVGRDDAAYRRNWVAIPLEADAATPGRWTAEIPASIQKHRRLIRYRVVDGASRKPLVPAAEDSTPNLAYFVYDGIPAWRGAVNPKGSGDEARAADFGTNVMRSVQAYHLISSRRMVEGAQWKEPTNFGNEEAHEYRWTGALVGADGTVYDHIHFRPRGGCWRYAMGKNMWKFDFNKGHKFRAADNWGRPYNAGWSKLNLGACIQQGDYGMRGEQGLFEAVGFRLFNLAGLPAPETHYIQLRVVMDADERGSSQFDGDFWGLYLAVENVDDSFVRQHSLVDQSVFKVDGMRPHWGKQGADKLTEVDAGRFVQSLFSRPDEAWWRKNINLPEYYAYRSIVECIHHYDLDGGKNYFFRRDPLSHQWTVVPWDIDLTWGEHMFGGGGEPFLQAGALRHGSIQREYQNRLREIRDLLFNPEQTGALIDEYAALIADPAAKDGLTFAEADRRKWDHHPIMSSRYVLQGMKTEPGMFYRAGGSGDLSGMVKLIKAYVSNRTRYIDSRLLARQSIPPAPAISAAGELKASASELRFAATGENEGTWEWRLAEVTPAKARTPAGVPRHYEISALWTTNGPARVAIPGSLVTEGHIYRVRARRVDANGNAGHYSAPLEFTAAK